MGFLPELLGGVTRARGVNWGIAVAVHGADALYFSLKNVSSLVTANSINLR